MAWQGRFVGVGVWCIAACLQQVQAAEVTWVSSQAHLQAALGGAALVTETFEDGVADGVVIAHFGPQHVVGIQGHQLRYAGIYGESFVHSTGGSGSGFQYVDSVSSSRSQETVWFFNQAHYGAGADWDLGLWGVGEGLKVYAVFAGGEQLISEVNRDLLGGLSRGYWGFTSDESFAALILRGAGAPRGSAETYAVDNISFGGASMVPEPQAVALWSLGLAGLAALQRRRAKRSVSASTAS